MEVAKPAVEVAARAETIGAALTAAGHPEVPARTFPDDLLGVHDPGLVQWPRSAYTRWTAAGYEQLVGQDRVVPLRLRHSPDDSREAGSPTHRRPCLRRRLVLRHDDAGRSRRVLSGQGGGSRYPCWHRSRADTVPEVRVWFVRAVT